MQAVVTAFLIASTLAFGGASSAIAPGIGQPATVSMPAQRLDEAPLDNWYSPAEFDDARPAALSCADENHCVAMLTVGGGYTTRVVTTTDGWLTSRAGSIGGLELAISDLQCPNPTRCVATGFGGMTTGLISGILVSNDSGLSWTLVMAFGDETELRGLSCPTVDRCFAIGSGAFYTEAVVYRTDDGGATWEVMSDPPSGSGGLLDIDCVTAVVCFATGSGSESAPSGTWRSDDAGMSWTQVDDLSTLEPLLVGLTSIDCVTELVCVTVGSSVDPEMPGFRSGIVRRTDDGGAKWVAQSFDFDSVSGIECTTERTCYTGGRLSPLQPGQPFIQATGSAGNYWARVPIEISTGSGVQDEEVTFGEVSCPTPSQCFALGSSSSTGFGGRIAGTVVVARSR